MSGSSIMEANSFRGFAADGDETDLQRLIGRRQRVLGGAYRLFYREPVHLVRGEGARLWDAEGREYIDMYNNVASLGHCHPAVVAAVTEQMSRLNTHTRYVHETIVDYTERLLETFPAHIDRAMYMCTGSEANDLAIRVARQYTGHRGIIVTAEAYHGTSDLTSGASPALGSGQPLAPEVRTVAAPDTYREGDAAGARFAADVRAAIADLDEHGYGVAGLLVDSILSSDGVLPGPRGMLSDAAAAVRAGGGVVIADEVQPGFGRTGETFWGFDRHRLDPEIVTLGKPMGNGMPVSGLVARGDVLAAFSDHLPYFNTFGGNPVSMAAASAVLRTLQEERLMQHSARVGEELLERLSMLALTHPLVGDVRGAGLFIGFELVSDRDTKEPATVAALRVLEELRRRGVLTSVAGPHGNVLKLRPPLAFQSSDIDPVIDALDEALSVVEH
ncbi:MULTISPECIES: aspartate aminotransferase family protein [Microbacterium]|uniref:aspartate aminotransferase family protein n=1 Tax=Microbacterium TaxID=33882 RepID=UPI0027898151|nr:MULTISPECIES: aspartate aminotransferase family protein [Microbacterium]MDQ1083066.1 4-aminobutyrate aminotransferase-like enzyme [Microbacterium sp. SORGH_AS_0344]MDQ1171662.1 4-aminobutyrate aminotransferase-like enzyme [Microbacterium proteolyticum]